MTEKARATLPDFVPPMLAKIGREPFSSDEHLFEIKWDGTRAIALVESGDYRLLNRKRRPAKDRYPELAALAGLPAGT
ncbi:MAG: DNA ligase, partial [bacterium]